MSTKPAIIISVVVLPEPDGPSREKNSPARIETSIKSTTRSVPYFLVTPASLDGTFAVDGGNGLTAHLAADVCVNHDLDSATLAH